MPDIILVQAAVLIIVKGPYVGRIACFVDPEVKGLSRRSLVYHEVPRGTATISAAPNFTLVMHTCHQDIFLSHTIASYHLKQGPDS